MLRGVLGESYDWPCGAYLSAEGFDNIMMAMPVTLSASGVRWSMPDGTEDDISALRESYAHLTALRDQTIDDGILPPLSEWRDSNIHLG
jgi:malate dehydrogenase